MDAARTQAGRQQQVKRSEDPHTGSGLRENFSGFYPWVYNSGALTAGNHDLGVYIQGAVYSLDATYAGPVSLSAAYQASNLPGVNKNAALVNTRKVSVTGIGLDWKTVPSNTVMGAVYFSKNKANGQVETTTLILSDEYALAKRTTLYGHLHRCRCQGARTACHLCCASR